MDLGQELFEDISRPRRTSDSGQAGSGFLLPDLSQWKFPQQNPDKAEAPKPASIIADNAYGSAINNGVLKLNFNDADFDQQLNRVDTRGRLGYDTLCIKMPPEVQLHYWADDKGFFFWFQGKNADATRHYIRPGLKTIEYADPNNPDVLDPNRPPDNIERKRMQTRQAYVNSTGTSLDCFYPSVAKQTDAIGFFLNMSGLAQDTLVKEEQFLRQQADKSSDPYWRVDLSQVLAFEALNPIIQQVLDHQPISTNTAQTLDKLQKAIEQVQLVQQAANGRLGSGHRRPPGDTVMGRWSYPYSDDPNSDGYFRHWGGALDQAQQLEVFYTLAYNLASMNALPDYLKKHKLFELP